MDSLKVSGISTANAGMFWMDLIPWGLMVIMFVLNIIYLMYKIKRIREAEMEWLSANWEWVLLGFMVLEKVVKMSPSDKDDILLDVVVQGLTKMVKGEKK